MKFRSKTKLFMVLLLSIMTAGSAFAANNNLYAVSADNTSIYEIDVTTGVRTEVTTTAQFKSVSLACDGESAYYWSAQNPSHRGLAKWDMATGIHSVILGSDIAEENACVDSSGNLWILDMTRSFVDGALLDISVDNSFELCQVDKNTGARNACYTLPDVGGYGVGDIDWGPDGKLYITTSNNAFWGYDTCDNYIWDPSNPTQIQKIATGEYHAGLAWVNGKLYSSKTVGNTGVIYELDPTDFTEIAQVATMPTGVSIGDLSNAVPEPATICLLGLSSIALLKRHKK